METVFSSDASSLINCGIGSPLSVAEFDAAYPNLISFCKLRAESIRSQLDGKLATITSEQAQEAKTDVSSVNIAAMRSQAMGRGQNN